jgi:anti-sigma factor RsiW
MSCRRARARLQSLLDGVLTTRTERALREHLARCPTCAQEYASLAAIGRALAGEPPPLPSPGLAAAIAREAALRAARRRALTPLWLEVITFTGVALIAAAVSAAALSLLGPAARAALGAAGMAGLIMLAVSAGIAGWGALYYRV